MSHVWYIWDQEYLAQKSCNGSKRRSCSNDECSLVKCDWEERTTEQGRRRDCEQLNKEWRSLSHGCNGTWHHRKEWEQAHSSTSIQNTISNHSTVIWSHRVINIRSTTKARACEWNAQAKPKTKCAGNKRRGTTVKSSTIETHYGDRLEACNRYR